LGTTGESPFANQFNFQSDRQDQEWWMVFTCHLLRHGVPGFTVKMPGEKKHGAPQEWTFRRLAELFADVEFLKKKTGLSVSRICETALRRKPYAKRWAQFGVEASYRRILVTEGVRRQRVELAI
jgi:hypothetical protein